MPADAASILNRVLLREKQSLLQYLSDAWPWTTLDDQSTLERLKKMIAEEQEAARRIADWLSRRRVQPATPGFPEHFTAIHYLGVDHLLPRLISHQRWMIGELEKDLMQLADEQARVLVQRVLDMKRRHLAELETLAAGHARGAAASTLR